MPCPRRSTTTKKPGFTLLEVAVASTLFLIMTGSLFGLFRQTQYATEAAIESTDKTSILLLLFEKTRSTLKGVRILGPTADKGLEFWKVRSVDGLPQLTGLGRPDYEPGAPAIPDSFFLTLEPNGNLVVNSSHDKRLLTRVGENSTLDFSWNSAAHLLKFSGEIRLNETAQPHKYLFQMYVSNNE